jgi:hypothetical protein
MTPITWANIQKILGECCLELGTVLSEFAPQDLNLFNDAV